MSEYDLIMPFLPVTSKGGPYDDEAFVAGYTCGRLDAALASGAPAFADWFPILSSLIPQIDLIAMRHGYVMEVRDRAWGDDSVEWAFVKLSRSGKPEETS